MFRWCAGCFVAFEVTASTQAPPAGLKLCGDLGPIQLSFPAVQPVIPSRIARLNSVAGPQPRWRIYAVAANQQQLGQHGDFGAPTPAPVYFAGPLRTSELGTYPALSALSKDGARLTVLDVDFHYLPDDDIYLEDNPAPADYRSRREVFQPCGSGCTVGGARPKDLIGMAVILGASAVVRRRGRRRQNA